MSPVTDDYGEGREDPRYTDLVREFFQDVEEILTDEWDSRTKLGKALFPLWVVTSTIQWAAVLSVLGFIAAATYYLKQLSLPNLPTHKENND